MALTKPYRPLKLRRGVQMRLQSTNPDTANWYLQANNKIDIVADGNVDTFPQLTMIALHGKHGYAEFADSATNGNQLNANFIADLNVTVAKCHERLMTGGVDGPATTHKRELLFCPRIMFGLGSPTGNTGGPNWMTQAPYNVPTITLGNGLSPIHWDATYQLIVRRFWNLFRLWCELPDGFGGYNGDWINYIPVSGPGAIAAFGTEMNCQYPGGGDQAAWDALTGFYPAGVTSSADKEKYRRIRIEDVWRRMTADQMAALPNHFHAIAVGGIFGDRDRAGNRLYAGCKINNGTLQAVTAGGSTTVTFNGTTHLGSNIIDSVSIGAALYKVIGGVKTLIGFVADVLSDTSLLLTAPPLAAANNLDGYSCEIGPIDTDNGRLCVQVTNYAMDTGLQGYEFSQEYEAEIVRQARLKNVPFVAQTVGYTSGTSPLSTTFPNNYKAIAKMGAIDALERFGCDIYETANTAFADQGEWLFRHFEPMLRAA